MKNMNLESMNLQALDIQDACQINGGHGGFRSLPL